MSEDIYHYLIASLEETNALLDALTSTYYDAISELSDRSLAVKDIKVKLSVEIVPLEIESENLLSDKDIVRFIENCYVATDNLDS